MNLKLVLGILLIKSASDAKFQKRYKTTLNNVIDSSEFSKGSILWREEVKKLTRLEEEYTERGFSPVNILAYENTSEEKRASFFGYRLNGKEARYYAKEYYDSKVKN